MRLAEHNSSVYTIQNKVSVIPIILKIVLETGPGQDQKQFISG
jgi:hypothetical protein